MQWSALEQSGFIRLYVDGCVCVCAEDVHACIIARRCVPICPGVFVWLCVDGCVCGCVHVCFFVHASWQVRTRLSPTHSKGHCTRGRPHQSVALSSKGHCTHGRPRKSVAHSSKGHCTHGRPHSYVTPSSKGHCTHSRPHKSVAHSSNGHCTQGRPHKSALHNHRDGHHSIEPPVGVHQDYASPRLPEARDIRGHDINAAAVVGDRFDDQVVAWARQRHPRLQRRNLIHGYTADDKGWASVALIQSLLHTAYIYSTDVPMHGIYIYAYISHGIYGTDVQIRWLVGFSETC